MHYDRLLDTSVFRYSRPKFHPTRVPLLVDDLPDLIHTADQNWAAIQSGARASLVNFCPDPEGGRKQYGKQQCSAAHNHYLLSVLSGSAHSPGEPQ